MVLSHDLEPAVAEDGVAFDDDGAESEADLGLNFADGAGDGFKLAGLRQRLHGAEVEPDVEKIATSRVGSQLFEMRHYLRQGDGSSTLRANPAFFGVAWPTARSDGDSRKHGRGAPVENWIWDQLSAISCQLAVVR